MKKYLLLVLFGWHACSIWAQDSVSVLQEDTVTVDSVSYIDEDEYSDFFETEEEAKDYNAAIDSANVDQRKFDANEVEKLKNDQALQYKETPTIAESIWMRFLRWLGELIDSFFQGAVETNWGRVLWWAFGIVVVVAIIMVLLKVDAFKVLYSGEGAKVKYQVIEENIHEMDFEKLIQEAVQQHDYRKGVRLIFLQALKMLADKHFIVWEQGKTNHDYVAELEKGELKTGFNELSFYFEYAWYGNFVVSKEVFVNVQKIFSAWRAKV